MPLRILKLPRAWWLAMLLVMGAYASARAPAHAPEAATFIVVRHAEQVVNDSRDPPLSKRGVARALALARRLAGAPLVAAYATPFRRTRQTAQPAAKRHHIAVTSYDAVMPPADFVASLRARHARGTILVVGHSNTVPEIVAGLCSCRIRALGEDDYDAIYTVHIGGDGRGVLDVGRQSAGSAIAP
jgi:broad specificity phosphatase PhoE